MCMVQGWRAGLGRPCIEGDSGGEEGFKVGGVGIGSSGEIGELEMERERRKYRECGKG